MPSKQDGLSLPDQLWKWIKDNYRKYGYQYHSQFVRREMIEYALKNNPRLKNPDAETVKTLESITEIANIAERRRGRKFSVSRAVKDYKEDVQGFKDALKEGFITKEQYNRLCAESKKDHRNVAQLEVKKDYHKEEEHEKHDLAWYRAQMKKDFMKRWDLDEDQYGYVIEYSRDESVNRDKAAEALLGEKR